DADARDDFAFNALARFGKFTQLTDVLRFTLTLDVDAQLWTQFEDLDNVAGGATASLRYRFGLGAMVPFVRVEASARYADFQQDLQDGCRYRATVVVGKRIMERLEMEAAYVFDRADTQSRLFE